MDRKPEGKLLKMRHSLRRQAFPRQKICRPDMFLPPAKNRPAGFLPQPRCCCPNQGKTGIPVQ